MKHKIFQDAVDFARIGEETRRALKPKKKLNNKAYRRQINNK